MTKLYFSGNEIPSYRNLLLAQGTKDVSLSYFGLRRRTKFTRPWKLSEKFQSDQNIFIDSGCYTINHKEHDYTDEELREIGSHYYRWVHSNIEQVEFYTEFDAHQLGRAYREETYESLRDVFFDKFVPIWSADDGLQALNDLSERFGRVGVLQTSIGGRDLVPTLNSLASRGVKLHGLSITKPDIISAVPWESVSSTSWLSPSQYGDTIVWSHNQLKRYPKKMKDQARKKERSVFMTNGFDVEKIESDDSTELLKLSIWSWNKLIESINRKTGVTTTMNTGVHDNSEPEDDEVGGVVEKAPNRLPTKRAATELPAFLSFQMDTEKDRITGEDIETPTLRVRGESARICDSCFLAAKCPMFEAGSTCAYNIPIVVRTKDQVAALMDSMVEIQAQRVLFMKMAEDAEGGYADPNLSSEIDRLGNLIKKKHDMEQEGFSLTVTAKQSGQMDTINRLFGGMGAEFPTGRELEAPVRANDAIENIYEGEFA